MKVKLGVRFAPFIDISDAVRGRNGEAWGEPAEVGESHKGRGECGGEMNGFSGADRDMVLGDSCVIVTASTITALGGLVVYPVLRFCIAFFFFFFPLPLFGVYVCLLKTKYVLRRRCI